MVSEMVQNSQSLYSFTFNAVIVIHDYIYSHLRDVFIHIQRVIFVHIHDRNIHSTFSAHHVCASLGPSSCSIISERNMADKGSVLHWQDLFSAALDPLQDCERE